MRTLLKLTAIGSMAASVFLSGCSMMSTAVDAPVAGAELKGVLHGGQQGISQSHIHVMAAGTGGYGGASTSLLTGPLISGTDAAGGYVLSATGGTFTIPTGSYTCTAGTQVYLYALGGDPGFGTNTAAGLMAVLGNCPGGNLASQVPTVVVNEVSTIAAAYAMAAFATDATHVSGTSSTLGALGLKNAFANAAQLAQVSTGTALATTPRGNGVVPQTTINTLANALAGCINTAGAGQSGCTNLFAAVKSNGLGGTKAGDTATEAIYIAHYPAVNVGTIYTLGGTQPPFSPALTGNTPPNDFTIGINYTGSGINNPEGIAIDASGNAWIANTNGNSVTELSPTGVPATGTPFTNNITNPQGIAIDTSANVWVTNFSGNSVTELTLGGTVGVNTTVGGQVQLPGGVAIDSAGSAWVTSLAGTPASPLIKILKNESGATAYSTGTGGMNVTNGVAIDYAGHVWVTDGTSPTGVTELLSTGTAVAGSPFFTTTFNAPTGVAIDNGGNAWIADAGGQGVTKVAPAGGSAVTYGGGGLDGSIGIAIDGGQSVWLANNTNVSQAGGVDGVSAFAGNGAALSPSTGYLGGLLYFPYAVAVDGSGNVWATNPTAATNITGSVTELIGAGNPVVTPIAASLVSPYTTAAALP